MNTIIEKIRAEVNRQARSIDTATGDFAEGRRMEQRIILSSLSNLEKECEEKPTNIDFKQELYKHFGQVKDFTLGMRIGQYFYELGKQSKQPACKELEKEIAKWFAELDKKYGVTIDFGCADIESTARHFAQWGAEHLKK